MSPSWRSSAAMSALAPLYSIGSGAGACGLAAWASFSVSRTDRPRRDDLLGQRLGIVGGDQRAGMAHAELAGRRP